VVLGNFLPTEKEIRPIVPLGSSADNLTSHTINVDLNENMLPKMHPKMHPKMLLKIQSAEKRTSF
jgi:hypothetical protein